MAKKKVDTWWEDTRETTYELTIRIVDGFDSARSIDYTWKMPAVSPTGKKKPQYTGQWIEFIASNAGFFVCGDFPHCDHGILKRGETIWHLTEAWLYEVVDLTSTSYRRDDDCMVDTLNTRAERLIDEWYCEGEMWD